MEDQEDGALCCHEDKSMNAYVHDYGNFSLFGDNEWPFFPLDQDEILTDGNMEAPQVLQPPSPAPPTATGVWGHPINNGPAQPRNDNLTLPRISDSAVRGKAPLKPSLKKND